MVKKHSENKGVDWSGALNAAASTVATRGRGRVGKVIRDIAAASKSEPPAKKNPVTRKDFLDDLRGAFGFVGDHVFPGHSGLKPKPNRPGRPSNGARPPALIPPPHLPGIGILPSGSRYTNPSYDKQAAPVPGKVFMAPNVSMVDPQGSSSQRAGPLPAAPLAPGVPDLKGSVAVVSQVRNYAVRGPNIQRYVTSGAGADTRHGVRIKHREPLGAINGTSAYAVTQYLVNPVNSQLFPWLSSMAGAYELYRFRRISLIFETEEGTNQKGRILLGADYAVTDSLPVNRNQFEQLQGTTVCKPWGNAVFHTSMPHTMHQSFYFIALSATGDPRMTYQNRLQWATVDCSDTGANGELWVEYDVDLMMSTSPAITSVGSSYLNARAADSVSGTILATNFIAATPASGSNQAISLAAATTATSSTVFAFRLQLPAVQFAVSGSWSPVPGSWLISVQVTNATSAGTWTAPSLNGCSLHTFNLNGYTTDVTPNTASASAAKAQMDVRVNTFSTTIATRPYVDIAITGTADSFTGVCVHVVSLMTASSTLGTPMAFFVGRSVSDQFVTVSREILNTVDGKKCFDSLVSRVSVPPDDMVLMRTIPLLEKENLKEKEREKEKEKEKSEEKEDFIIPSPRPRVVSQESMVAATLPRSLAQALVGAATASLKVK